MTIAVTGATGQLGRRIIAAIKARAPNQMVIALARSPERASDLGVEVHRFDYADPKTLAPALIGVDTLMLVSSSEIGQRAEQHNNVIAAAEAAGMRRIVYTSVLHADTSPIGLAEEHRVTEAALAASPLKATILRNGWYTENMTGGTAGVIASGTMIGSSAHGRFSAATRDDYAEAAAAVLTSDGHAGRTYELGGDDAFTRAQLAAEISRQTGRDIQYRNLSEADHAAALRDAGVPPQFAEMLARLDTQAADDVLFDMSGDLRTLIGRPTTSLAAAVAAAIG